MSLSLFIRLSLSLRSSRSPSSRWFCWALSTSFLSFCASLSSCWRPLSRAVREETSRLRLSRSAWWKIKSISSELTAPPQSSDHSNPLRPNSSHLQLLLTLLQGCCQFGHLLTQDGAIFSQFSPAPWRLRTNHRAGESLEGKHDAFDDMFMRSHICYLQRNYRHWNQFSLS